MTEKSQNAENPEPQSGEQPNDGTSEMAANGETHEAASTPTPDVAQAGNTGDSAPAQDVETSSAEHPASADSEPGQPAEAPADEAEAVAPPSSKEASSPEASTSDSPGSEPSDDESRSVEGQDPRPELRQLMELAVKYPEIGPPLAELAFKVGSSDIGERIVKMGLDDGSTTGVEYYAVAVDVARREGRYEEVFAQVEDALETFQKTPDDAVTDDEANRLLHLVRNGFAVLLFDLEDVNAKPEWVETLGTQLPRLEERYAEDPFYYSLLAQARWFSDKEQSEKTWEKAVELSEGDFAWNARGTWYKDAAGDFERAQAAYRKGLDKWSNSALLLHNLAQLLTDEAQKKKSDDPEKARGWLREADELVRRALRQQTRRGLRRYIHGTKDRVRKMLSNLPAEEVEPPKEGEVLEGRVVAVVQYGAFITIRGGLKGLLHKSEIAHERDNDPGQFMKVGDKVKVKVISVKPQDDGTMRIGFSRKALLEAPANAPKKKHSGNKRGGGKKGKKSGRNKSKGHRDKTSRGDGIGTLGEMLLAKLEEAKGQSDD